MRMSPSNSTPPRASRGRHPAVTVTPCCAPRTSASAWPAAGDRLPDGARPVARLHAAAAAGTTSTRRSASARWCATTRDACCSCAAASPPGKGLWALPAGFVDADEDPREAAAREVTEETGLTVAAATSSTSTRAAAARRSSWPSRPRVTGGVLAAADDALDAGFFALDALPELAFESTRTWSAACAPPDRSRQRPRSSACSDERSAGRRRHERTSGAGAPPRPPAATPSAQEAADQRAPGAGRRRRAARDA